MGFWLIAALALQLACAVSAAMLARPAVWLQIILLVPVFGALAYCAFELIRLRSRAVPSGRPERPAADTRQRGDLGGLGYRAVSARTAESRLALAEECMLLGRHADARLLFESSRRVADAQGADFLDRLERAEARMRRRSATPVRQRAGCID